MDRTISYLLLHCCKIKAVSGVAGKVLQMRNFFKETLGYKETAVSTVNDLITFLVSRLEGNQFFLFFLLVMAI